jgi:lipopolysaccharide/colanic/teichoic acid biosynthesis glycosyltransferase
MARRLFEIVFSSICLALFLIPGLVVCLLVKLTSPGPIFYLQRRVGAGARPFWLIKFRTMQTRPSEGVAVTKQGDPRITSIGRFLRKWKIDEVPQMWNILRGDMSVVGPRPEMEQYVQYYTPEERRILSEKPGLAGMAQLVYPHEAELLATQPDTEWAYVHELMPAKLKADLDYETFRTFPYDLRLMGEIALAMLGHTPRKDTSFRFHGPEALAGGGAAPAQRSLQG